VVTVPPGRGCKNAGVTPRTLVAFHAHPDDEALLSAGTLALASAAGHRVVLVLATSGEAGLVGADVLGGEDLGRRRAAEAQASADALGVARLVLLGYGDSGSAPLPEAEGWPEGSFCAAGVEEAAERLAAVLRDEGADLLVADDANGGYGPPDHLQVNRVASAAAATTGVPFLQVTIDREFLSGGIELARSMGLEVPEGFVPPDVSAWYTAHDDITHTVDAGPALAAKRASMAAHATQATGAPDTVRTLAVFLGLPEEIFAIAFSQEWFVLDPASAEAASARPDELFPGLFTAASSPVP
jgi:LmbE family N-acetylglucosaminyl deacetylase